MSDYKMWVQQSEVSLLRFKNKQWKQFKVPESNGSELSISIPFLYECGIGGI